MSSPAVNWLFGGAQGALSASHMAGLADADDDNDSAGVRAGALAQGADPPFAPPLIDIGACIADCRCFSSAGLACVGAGVGSFPLSAVVAGLASTFAMALSDMKKTRARLSASIACGLCG